MAGVAVSHTHARVGFGSRECPYTTLTTRQDEIGCDDRETIVDLTSNPIVAMRPDSRAAARAPARARRDRTPNPFRRPPSSVNRPRVREVKSKEQRVKMHTLVTVTRRRTPGKGAGNGPSKDRYDKERVNETTNV